MNDKIDKIHRRMLSKLDNKFDKSVGSWAYDLLKPAAIEIYNTSDKVDELNEKRKIKNLHGEELDDYITQNSPVKRLRATHSVGAVTIKGQEGAKVEEGILVASASNEYVVTKGSVIKESGQTTVPVESVETGVHTNADIGVVNVFPITISGLEVVFNEEPIIGGFDEESDDDYRNRYLEFLRLPITSGNVYHYELWAKEVTGVGGVKVNPLWNGEGTVEVVIIDAEQGVASEELKKEVFDYIETQRPIGAKVTVNSAQPLSIKITADIVLARGYLISNIEKEFQENLEEYRKEIAFKETYVSYAKIGKILLETDGVLDYENLLLNNDTKNIPIEENETPVIEDITLGVV